jgi:hypothetical protein
MSNGRLEYEQCRATLRSGEQCRGRALTNGLCWAHDPAVSKDQAKGGRARSNAARSIKAMPAKLQPVASLLTTAMARTFQGHMDPRQATALAALAGAYIRVVESGEFELKVRELEQRLATAG